MEELVVFPQQHIAIIKRGNEILWYSVTTGEILEWWEIHKVPRLIRESKKAYPIWAELAKEFAE